MRHFAAALTLVFCALSARAPAAMRPNIIIVMPDDMGYGDLGVTGNPVIRTPNLDRFAAQSTTLTDFYVSPVCSPTRASLMTGRYNYRTRVIDTFKGRSMMDPAEVTLAERLQQVGYATGIFGKWHLGDNYPLRPQDQGFDEVLVHRGGGLAQPSEPIENQRRYTDPILFHNGRKVKTQGYCTDVYFDAAIEFMKQSRSQHKPFFVYLPPNAPHGPYHDVPSKPLKHYQSVDLTSVLGDNVSEKHRDTVARVFAMVENIDQNFGRLEDYLASSGEKQNTIVLFLTDNGPNTNRYVGPFREMKSWVHEGGIRTVFFARWPGKFSAGHSNASISAHIDILPTLLAAAEIEIPDMSEIDGRSLLPVLQGQKELLPDRNLFLQSHRGDQPVEFHHIAVRSQQWKLVRPTGFGREVPNRNVPFELYRIQNDAGEKINVANMYPKQLASMQKAYQDWLASVSSTRPDNYAPPRIIVGSDEELESDLSIQDWRVGDAPGWGADGHWKVHVENAGPFDATVSWSAPPGERAISVTVGDQVFSAHVSDDESTVTLPQILLPTGDADVHVTVQQETGEKVPVIRFLTLRRIKN